MGPGGALVDELETGDMVLVESVVAYQRGTWNSTGWAFGNAGLFELAPLEVAGASVPWGELRKVRLASGEAFIASDGQRQRLAKETGASIVDMNSYGLAAACARKKIPLLNLKICSDHANDSAGEDFANFIEHYDGRLGKLVAGWIETLPLSKVEPKNYNQIRELVEGEESK